MQNSSAGCGSTTTFEAARGHRGERQCHSEKSRNLVGGDLGSICSCVRLLEDVNDNHVGTSDRYTQKNTRLYSSLNQTDSVTQRTFLLLQPSTHLSHLARFSYRSPCLALISHPGSEPAAPLSIITAPRRAANKNVSAFNSRA